MPRPQISEAIIFEGGNTGDERGRQLAWLAGSGSVEAARQAEERAVELSRFLYDKLGYWMNDGVLLEHIGSSGLPYDLRIAAQNRYRGGAEIVHAEVEVAPASGQNKTGFRLDTTNPWDSDPTASLVVVDPVTGAEYPVTASEPGEQLGVNGVVGRLETDIERELMEERFRVQPLLH
jgi:hypothetical protein